MFHQAIMQSIEDFAKAFAARPFDYLFEIDVQADLHGRLRRALESNPVSLNQVRDRPLFREQQADFSRVHAEYPTGMLFDLALIADADTQASIWNQPLGAALELKLWQADGGGGGINDDLRKLHRWLDNSAGQRFLGVVLIAGHPGKDVATVGGLDRRTPPLQRLPAGPRDSGIFVCAVDAAGGAGSIRWWESSAAPEAHQG